jgi:hypothetical protein
LDEYCLVALSAVVVPISFKDYKIVGDLIPSISASFMGEPGFIEFYSQLISQFSNVHQRGEITLFQNQKYYHPHHLQSSPPKPGIAPCLYHGLYRVFAAFLPTRELFMLSATCLRYWTWRYYGDHWKQRTLPISWHLVKLLVEQADNTHHHGYHRVSLSVGTVLNIGHGTSSGCIDQYIVHQFLRHWPIPVLDQLVVELDNHYPFFEISYWKLKNCTNLTLFIPSPNGVANDEPSQVDINIIHSHFPSIKKLRVMGKDTIVHPLVDFIVKFTSRAPLVRSMVNLQLQNLRLNVSVLTRSLPMVRKFSIDCQQTTSEGAILEMLSRVEEGTKSLRMRFPFTGMPLLSITGYYQMPRVTSLVLLPQVSLIDTLEWCIIYLKHLPMRTPPFKPCS